ncbi:MAG: ammonium transporter [Oscillospiraceae bacterium]|jgi:Amt family ammonium transporter|nr:ammonium transporter [Oscillospiraceae bacterium]
MTQLLTESLASTAQGVNILWTLVAAALVFFMQAGFAMVETGFTRAKNAGNIIMKNLMDFACGTPVFWCVGFGIMFGGGGALIGGLDLFTGAAAAADQYDYTTLMFQTVFCATAATIVSGAMAERTRFRAYLLYSVAISALVYPVSGHWIWGGGWLSGLGFHDFAGSTAVHMVGGVASLVGAKMLGARIGKYGRDGKSRAIPGHSLTLGALGVFILWFCWFGFNGGSTTAMLTDTGGGVLGHAAALLASKVFVTTNLAAAVAAVAAMAVTWIKYKRPDVSMTLNGALAGLVAITAGCDVVNPWAAAVVGLAAGAFIVPSIEWIDKVLKTDDPVGAIGVHGVCGALGTVLTGLLISDADLAALNAGRLREGAAALSRAGFLGVQVLGVAAVALWVGAAMTVIFFLIKKTVGLRVAAEAEVLGLDMAEHGLASSYADFLASPEALEPAPRAPGTKDESAPVPVEQAIPVVHRKHPMPYTEIKFTKVDIVTKPQQLEPLKVAMNEVGITGMTVTNVMGFGMQKGNQAYYRGVEMDVNFLPKIKLEIVVCKVPVQTVIETAKTVLYTGRIGDGKIFVYDVENVVKVRTGEEGYDALQDVE